MFFLVIYQKNETIVFGRIVKSLPFYEVGSYTSNGWKVLSIQIFNKGKFINYDKYLKKISVNKQQRYINLDKRNKILSLLENIRELFR